MVFLQSVLNKRMLGQSVIVGLGAALLSINAVFAMPAGGSDRMMAHLTSSLSLNETQQATLQTLVEAQRKVIEAQRTKTNAAIEAMLSVEQLSLFKEFQTQGPQSGERRGGKGGRGHGGPEGCGPRPE